MVQSGEVRTVEIDGESHDVMVVGKNLVQQFLDDEDITTKNNSYTKITQVADDTLRIEPLNDNGSWKPHEFQSLHEADNWYISGAEKCVYGVRLFITRTE